MLASKNGFSLFRFKNIHKYAYICNCNKLYYKHVANKTNI
ncbi:rCG58784, isoform CRA_b [Rattus norvegicus]|uniref:RCG58784, isoform CRA_b n=1 Tax=Rattus norvegicus TaxID=10116 RepID=A6JL55_RAT|nr:rCG58784, isoform CRA_b [Rattus norvegicus]